MNADSRLAKRLMKSPAFRKILRHEVKKACSCCVLEIKKPKWPAKTSRWWIPTYPFMFFYYFLLALLDFIILTLVFIAMSIICFVSMWEDNKKDREIRKHILEPKEVLKDLGIFHAWRDEK